MFLIRLNKGVNTFAIKALQVAIIMYLQDDISPRRGLSRNEF